MRHTRFTAVIGLFSIAVGAVVLLGWALGKESLTALIPGQTTMKANTALGMLLLGVALRLRGRGAERAAGVAGFSVLVIGAATLGEYVAGRGFGIDELAFVDPNRVQAGRMGLNAAISFCLVGPALIP